MHAAVKAGVKYIMPNVYGPDFMKPALRAESSSDLYSAGSYEHCMEIEKAGASYVGMVCGFWYEWRLDEFSLLLTKLSYSPWLAGSKPACVLEADCSP